MSTTTEVRQISCRELFDLKESGAPVELIDVRTPAEFREVHIDFARNQPLERFNAEQVLAQRRGDAQEPLYLVCRTGNRGNQAAEKLIKAGFDNVVNLQGGTQAWDEAGLPVERGKKTISLERQVRIAAGFLVLVGVVSGYFYAPLLGLAAFVGAGLMFAGITDTCGMALLLARMPWNQVKSCEEDDSQTGGTCNA